MSIVHDNIIKSYCVDFQAETLVIKTVYHNHTENAVENTDIIFTDYLTHNFCNADKYSIIFDIEEYPLARFLEAESELLKDRKNYGWPVSYETENELVEFMQTNGYRTFALTSSCGLHGWVISKKMDITAHKEQND